ncbi:unnamed protein product [Symbiodinium sp. KB8]|nr:unnamed protein product [Symbiodinium sp. KB8]
MCYSIAPRTASYATALITDATPAILKMKEALSALQEKIGKANDETLETLNTNAEQAMKAYDEAVGTIKRSIAVHKPKPAKTKKEISASVAQDIAGCVREVPKPHIIKIPLKTAYNGRVISSWLASVCAEAASVHKTERLQLTALAVWHLHDFYCKIESADRYLTAEEAAGIRDTGLQHLVFYTKLAHIAVAEGLAQAAHRATLENTVLTEWYLRIVALRRLATKRKRRLNIKHSLKVECKVRDTTKAHLNCRISCTTHWDRDTQKMCPWHGVAQVNPPKDDDPTDNTCLIQLRYEPAASHAPHERNIGGGLTWQQRQVATRAQSKNTADVEERLRDLKCIENEEKLLSPPKPQQLGRFMVRLRSKLTKSGVAEVAPGNQKTYQPSDFEFLQAKFDPEDTNLRVVDMQVSTDGTYRLLRDNYALLTFGINVKNYSQRMAALTLPLRKPPSTWRALSATILGRSTFYSGMAIDLHKGIEAARAAVAPKSARLSDWAHVTGATSLGPGGFAGLLKQHLPIAQHKAIVPLMLQWQRLSKTMPAILFHVVWTTIFAWLDAEGLQACTTALKRHYFTVENDQIAASWRSASDRIMPGTDVGSAPQESWHNHKLKCHCKPSMKTPYTLARALGSKVVQGQVQVLKHMSQRGEKLQDWPHIG